MISSFRFSYYRILYAYLHQTILKIWCFDTQNCKQKGGLTIVFLSLSVFPRISVSGSVGFRYHGNGREARHLFRDFEQKSDSCNIAGLGRQPDRVPSRGYRGGPGK